MDSTHAVTCRYTCTVLSPCMTTQVQYSVILGTQRYNTHRYILVNEEEKRRKKMDDGVDASFTSDGTDLFVDLWEAQPCLWDPE